MRLRIALDRVPSAAGINHVELDFDPAVGARPTRTLSLGAGRWRATFISDALVPMEGADGKNSRILLFPPSELDLRACKSPASPATGTYETYEAMADGPKSKPAGAQRVNVTFTAQESPGSLAEARQGWSGPASVSGDGRSGLGATQVANDVLQLLGEIAIERAKTRALAVLTDRVQDFLCKKLVYSEELANSIFGHDRPDSRLGAAILPRSCEVAQHVRMSDLAGSVHGVFNAITVDLVNIASAYVGTHSGTLGVHPRAHGLVRRLLSRTLKLVADGVTRHTPLTSRDAQTFLMELARESFQDVGSGLTNRGQSPTLPIGFMEEFSTLRDNCKKATDALSNAEESFIAGQKVFNDALSIGSDATLTGAAQTFLNTQGHVVSARATVDKCKVALDKARGTLETVFAAQIPDATYDKNVRILACGFEIGFAVMAKCQSQANCDASAIAELLLSADEQFELGECTPVWMALTGRATDGTAGAYSLAEVIDVWPDLPRFISRGVAIADPARGTTARQQLRATVELAFDVVERFVELKSNKAVTKVLRTEQENLARVREMALAIIDQDIQTAITTAAALLESVLEPLAEDSKSNTRELTAGLRKATAVLAAVAGYAESYAGRDGADSATVAARREARKQAIERLIDATTDRREREGEWIVSLGATAGFTGYGVQHLFNPAKTRDATGNVTATQEPTQQQYLQLGLPMGIAVQEMPVTSETHGRLANLSRRYSPGWHFQASFVDLAQFIAQDESGKVADVEWSNFLMVGGQVGIILGTPSNPVIIAADLRYAPTLFTGPRIDKGEAATGDTRSGGAVRFGLFFAYYLPFFDFN